jgi:hypothetical protein
LSSPTKNATALKYATIPASFIGFKRAKDEMQKMREVIEAAGQDNKTICFEMTLNIESHWTIDDVGDRCFKFATLAMSCLLVKELPLKWAIEVYNTVIKEWEPKLSGFRKTTPISQSQLRIYAALLSLLGICHGKLTALILGSRNNRYRCKLYFESQFSKMIWVDDEANSAEGKVLVESHSSLLDL